MAVVRSGRHEGPAVQLMVRVVFCQDVGEVGIAGRIDLRPDERGTLAEHAWTTAVASRLNVKLDWNGGW